MRKPIIAIKLSPQNYGGLVALGNTVVEGLTGNINFVSPAIPLVNLKSAITDVINAIGLWGPKGNRGSHNDLVDLRKKALLLADMLKAEAQYVQSTAHILCGVDYPAMTVVVTTSGFGVANAPVPQGKSEKVQNLHHFISRKLNKNQVKLRWQKPLNTTSRSNMKEYKILRSNSADFNAAVEVGVSTKVIFIDENTSPSAVKWTYWIIPYNSHGAGVASEPITVDVLGV